MKGHAEHDAQAYVDGAELERWRANDPVARCERQLEESGVLDAPARERLQEDLRRQLDDDVAFAEASPWPEPSLARQGVWADETILESRLDGVFVGGM
jgi:TPP-dependent pyruvate/acetoin dehydrogenase alpha subunit